MSAAAAASPPRLEVEGLVVEYGRSRAVDGLSLRVGPGGCVGIVGANGAGKTSAFRCLAGLQKPRSGAIRFDAREASGRNPWALARQGLRLVPETRELFGNLSVAENLRVGALNLPAGERRAAVEFALEVFSALRPITSRKARLLSGGQQQMLAIARALAGRPRLLLLDEPTLGLAPNAVAQLTVALRTVRSTGVAILIAEQNLGLPRLLCDEVVVMRLGRSVVTGPPAELLDTDTVRRAYLGAQA